MSRVDNTPASLRAFDVGDGDDEPATEGDCSLLDGLCKQACCRHRAMVDDPNEFGLASGKVSMLAPFAR